MKANFDRDSLLALMAINAAKKQEEKKEYTITEQLTHLGEMLVAIGENEDKLTLKEQMQQLSYTANFLKTIKEFSDFAEKIVRKYNIDVSDVE